jgi:hypothetical protein
MPPRHYPGTEPATRKLKTFVFLAVAASVAVVTGLGLAVVGGAPKNGNPTRQARSLRVVDESARTPRSSTDGERRGDGRGERPEAGSKGATPSESLDGLRSAVQKRDWNSFRDYVDEDAVIEAFLNKVDKEGLAGPGGNVILKPGLDPVTRALIGRIALQTLRRVVQGEAVASGVNGGTVDSALDSMHVSEIIRNGSVARVIITGGPMRRAVLKMRLIGGEWRVVAVEDYG